MCVLQILGGFLHAGGPFMDLGLLAVNRGGHGIGGALGFLVGGPGALPCALEPRVRGGGAFPAAALSLVLVGLAHRSSMAHEPASASTFAGQPTALFPHSDLGYRLRPLVPGNHTGGLTMIMRLDRLQAEIPPPSDPDPNGASIVQELLGGKFGEMSTFMNYTYQSFNFRNRQGARPFYDLVASIAAEEFGHIELVATAINTMLTGALDGKPGKSGALKGLADCRNSQEFLAGGASATVQDSMGKPWNGDYVNATGDLIGDLTHNFFLETGARNNKLKVYEAVDHPAARALTGYLLVRGGVHQVAYARALENLTGARMEKLFPTPGSRPTRSPSASRTSNAVNT